MSDGVEQDVKDIQNIHRTILRGPGDVAIEAKDRVKDSGFAAWDWIKGKTEDAVNSVFNKSAQYDKEAQKAYENRASIVSTFAAEYQNGKISPDTMKNMEYLKDKNALSETSSARISSGLYDYVKENPTNFGLSVKETATYQGGKQDITLYGSMKA